MAARHGLISIFQAAVTGASLSLAALPQLATAAGTTDSCAQAENGQFDFWVGEWDVVFTADGKPAGHSLVEKLYGGCALRENWQSHSGYVGGSLNFYDRTAGRWRQTWIGSDGVPTDYAGGLSGSAMVFRATLPGESPGKTVAMRMTFTPLGDGSVRQLIEASDDGGANWRPEYDLTYRRR